MMNDASDRKTTPTGRHPGSWGWLRCEVARKRMTKGRTLTLWIALRMTGGWHLDRYTEDGTKVVLVGF